jgi:hypothetical protein
VKRSFPKRKAFVVLKKNVQVRLNQVLLVDYMEPDDPVRIRSDQEHVLGHGTFALQGHAPGSKVRFRDIMVRPLPEDWTAPTAEKPVVDQVYLKLLRLSDGNYPLVDYHVHLKGGWTLEEALQESRRTTGSRGSCMASRQTGRSRKAYRLSCAEYQGSASPHEGGLAAKGVMNRRP